MNATFVQRGEAVDFVPTRNVEAGEILRFGGLLGIVKIPVKSGELGALHLGGIFDVVKTAEAIAAGSRVFWSEAASAATSESLGNAFLGVAACHSQASAAKVRIILNFGHPDSEGGGSPDGIQWQTIN